MITQILGIKRQMTQAWTTDGIRIPVTVVNVSGCTVLGKGKTDGKLLVGAKPKKLKNVPKPQRAQYEKANIATGFVKVAEVRADGEDLETVSGTVINPTSVLSVGDMVKVTGISKGTGFTGVVKRWGFKGGSRTHGQADRERAPGSIGSGTTPGRVYKNKKMAGRAGNEQVTVEGLQVVAFNGDEVWIKGLIPGAMNGIVTITNMGAGKFAGLLEHKQLKVVKAVEADAPAEVETQAEAEVKAE